MSERCYYCSHFGRPDDEGFCPECGSYMNGRDKQERATAIHDLRERKKSTNLPRAKSQKTTGINEPQLDFEFGENKKRATGR